MLNFITQDVDFPESSGIPRQTLKRVQSRLLEMAKVITDIFDDEGIKYIIAYGTLLGAIRHGGFIPWDDDFDLMVFGDDYENALDALRSRLPEDMLVHNEENDPMYCAYWARVRDLTSLIHSKDYPKDNKHKYRGLNVDLYRLDKIPRNKHLSNGILHNIVYYKKLLNKKIGSKEEIELKIAELDNKLTKAISEEKGLNDDSVFSFILSYPQVELDIVLPRRRFLFEGWEFWGPNKADSFLRMRYGNYNELPPFQDRVPSNDRIDFIEGHNE